MMRSIYIGIYRKIPRQQSFSSFIFFSKLSQPHCSSLFISRMAAQTCSSLLYETCITTTHARSRGAVVTQFCGSMLSSLLRKPRFEMPRGG